MPEDFRSRMGGVLEEIERLTAQAEEWERIAREEQVRIEEMDLSLRQRDEQLAERQSRVEELEEAIGRRDQELEALRDQLAEGAEALPRQEQELAALRAQLAEKEAVEAVIREELARLTAPVPPAVGEALAPAWAAQISALAEQVRAQGEGLAAMRTLVQEEMARLHGRLDRFEAGLEVAAPAAAVAAAPVEAAAPPVEVVEAAPVSEMALPVEVAVAPPEAVPLAAPPLPAAPEEPLHALLYEAMEVLPGASCIGLASLDGLAVAMLARVEQTTELPLEIGLADLTREAARVASAMGTGPLLTLAFQSGAERFLISPVGEDHFAFLLAAVEGSDDFRRAQAILLQTAIRLNEVS